MKPQVLILFVDAAHMPEDVIDYCVDNVFDTHYQNDVAYIENDNNVFAIWLRKEYGYVFRDTDGDWIAILST